MMTTSAWREFHRPDLGYSARFRLEAEHVADFEMFNLVYLEDNDPAKPRFEARDATMPIVDAVSNLDEAEIYCSGYVKWDGCLSFKMPPQQSIHMCGQCDGRKFGEMVVALWDMAAQVIPAWDHGVADTKIGATT